MRKFQYLLQKHFQANTHFYFIYLKRILHSTGIAHFNDDFKQYILISYMKICLLTLTVFCALLWLIIVARDVTRDRTGSTMMIERATVLRDVANLLAAFSIPRIEVS